MIKTPTKLRAWVDVLPDGITLGCEHWPQCPRGHEECDEVGSARAVSIAEAVFTIQHAADEATRAIGDKDYEFMMMAHSQAKTMCMEHILIKIEDRARCELAAGAARDYFQRRGYDLADEPAPWTKPGYLCE